MLTKMKKGQTAIEYVMLLIIVMGAFLAMQAYMKRGFQGRWRDAIDDLGDQYDPHTQDSSVRHSLDANTNTRIMTMNVVGGYWTMRRDESTSIERKTGTEKVGAY